MRKMRKISESQMRKMREMGYAPDPFKTLQYRIIGVDPDRVHDARKLADIFIDETKRYFQGVIPFQVIFVAVENIINRVLRAVPDNWQSNWQSHLIMNNHILALEMIKEKWDPPFRFLRRDGTIPRGTYVDDTCKLADIFMDETSKYYKGNAIHFGVICVAAEIILIVYAPEQ